MTTPSPGTPPKAGEHGWTLEDDLASIYSRVGSDWEALREARIFITGATGFIGRWLLESLRHADAAANLNVSVTILTRSPDGFCNKAPELARWNRLNIIAGDICSFDFPDGAFTHLIHAATDASADLNDNNPRAMFDTIVLGTRHVLDFATARNVGRTLHLSSGGIYGPQPWDVTHIREDWTGAPDCTRPVNAYGEGKRASEMLCAIYGRQFGLKISLARIFALLGPHLPLNLHFAAGNFIRDAMAGRKITVNGDGRPCRSYLYAADLAVALWRMLVRGPAGKAFNVGSEETVSIRQLAESVAATIGQQGFEILGQPDTGWNPGRYVPDMNNFIDEFGPVQSVTLDEAIRRTAMWNGWTP